MQSKSKMAWACVGLLTALSVGRAAAEDPSAKRLVQAEKPNSAPAPAPSVTVLGSKQAQSVLGKDVRSTANENMGRIVDIIVDHEGVVRAAIIDFGGFLGVGSRKIAVDWNALHFAAGSDKSDAITLDLTRDQVKGAPEYKDKHAVVVLGAAGALRPLPFE